MKGLRNSKGFTLIELIVIIIILGILAATAIPKFVDLQQQAKKGVAEGVLGALRSAEVIKFSNYLLSSATYTLADVVTGVQVDGAAISYSGDQATIVVGSGAGSTYNITYSRTAGDLGYFTKSSGW